MTVPRFTKLGLLKISLLVSVILLNLSTLQATTYYVSTTGNDANTGLTSTTAWRSLTKVNSIDIKPGDKILFQGGQTFTGNLYLDEHDANDSTSLVTISSYGTGRAILNAENRFGIYAYNTQGFIISNLIINGSGIDTNTDDGILIYTDLSGDVKLKFITIKNVVVKNFGKTGISIGSWNKNTGYKNVTVYKVHVYNVKQNGISVWGYTAQTHVGWAHKNVNIKNSQVYNVTGFPSSSHEGSGIIMGQVDQGLIERCVAHDNGTGNTHCGGPGGIWVVDSNNILLQYCESYNNSKGTGCDGFGFDFDGGVTNSTMQYNYAHNNEGAGFFVGQYSSARPWANNTIRYNISENDARVNHAGILIFKGSNSTMTGLKVYHNTVYITPTVLNSSAAAFAIKKWNTGINDVTVYNNIFQTSGGVPLISIPIGYSAYFAGNLYWTSGNSFKIKYQGVTYGNLSTWRTATNNEKVGEVITGFTVNPLLTNVGMGITVYPRAAELLDAYKFALISPASNSGLNLRTLFGINSGTRDYFGNGAPFGTAPDIGAFENPLSLILRERDSLSQVIEADIDLSVKIFPNPVHRDRMVEVSIDADDLFVHSVEIFSMKGELMSESENGDSKIISISLKNIAAGIYLVRVVDSNGKISRSKLLLE